jgi:uncharacterized DUF497 family protein
MQFEWNEAKNIENIRKHEIDFADVPTMFDGKMLIELSTYAKLITYSVPKLSRTFLR